jgi:hypothetical protein
MARQERSARQKTQDTYQQKQMRRGQVVMAVLTLIIILSMILSLVISL